MNSLGRRSPELEDLLDVFGVAKILGVHKDTIYKWTRLGILPAVHLPSGWIRYDPKDLAEFLKKCTTGKLG